MKFSESALAHKYLDGLKGLEIGGSAHNSFGLNTLNVDYTGDLYTIFKNSERDICGKAMPVDIVADAGRPMPFLLDGSEDFILSSHVLEHIYDPISALREWSRIVRPGGYIFTIVPKRDALEEDAKRPLTTLSELVSRVGKVLDFDDHRHWSVWTHVQTRELLEYMIAQGAPWEIVEVLEEDDKVKNGHCFVVRKLPAPLQLVAPVAQLDWVLPVEDT